MSENNNDFSGLWIALKFAAGLFAFAMFCAILVYIMSSLIEYMIPKKHTEAIVIEKDDVTIFSKTLHNEGFEGCTFHLLKLYDPRTGHGIPEFIKVIKCLNSNVSTENGVKFKSHITVKEE
jgi:hypothetical protein